jgi:hypothetical protein
MHPPHPALLLTLSLSGCVIAKSVGDDPETAAVDEEGGANESSSASTSSAGGSTYIETGSTGNGSDPGNDATSQSASESTAGWELEDCSSDNAPAVAVSVQPEALPGETLVYFLNCSITSRTGSSPDPVSFELDCVDEAGSPHGSIEVSVDAAKIIVPPVLQAGADVEARIFTARGIDNGGTGSTGDGASDSQFQTHAFVLLQEGEMLLSAGNGTHWPSTDTMSLDEFTAPLTFEGHQTDCPGEANECHETSRGQMKIFADGEKLLLNDFSSGFVSDYAAHIGKLITSDSQQCDDGEVVFWVAYAVARR